MSLSGDAGCAPRLVCHASLPCHGSAAGTASPTSSRGPGRGTGRGLSLMRRPGDSGRPCRRLLLIVASSIRASTVRSSFRGPGVHHHAPPPAGQAPAIPRPGPRVLTEGAPCRLWLCLQTRLSGGEALGRRRRRQSSGLPTGPPGLSGAARTPLRKARWSVGGGPARPSVREGAGPGPGREPELVPGVLTPWGPWGVVHGGQGLGGPAGREERQCSDPRDLPWASPTPGRGGSEGDLGTRRWHLLVLTPGRPSP